MPGRESEGDPGSPGCRSLRGSPRLRQRRYFEEAKWALKWGMLREAQEASESSWALGLRTKEAAELRIRTYAAEAASFPPGSIYVNPHNPAYAPDPSKLKPLTRALELYQEAFQTFLTHEPKPDNDWYHLGLDLLHVTWGTPWEKTPSHLMRQFHYFSAFWQPHQEELATVRSLMRDTVAMFKSQPAYTNLNPPLAVAELGGYWQDTPEQGVEAYRRLADTDYLHNQRMKFAHHNLVGWNEADASRCDAVWRGFVTELCNSTNPVTRVEGYFQKFADAPTPVSQRERLQEFIDVAVENAVAVNNKMWNGGSLLSDIHYIIGDGPRGFYGLEEEYKMDIQFHDDFREAILNGPRVVRLQEMTNYLTGLIAAKKPVDPALFDKSLPHESGPFPFDGGNYGKVAAKTLIPMLREYRNEITGVPGQDEDSQQPLLKSIDTLSGKLQALLAPPPPTNAVAAAPHKPEVVKPHYTLVVARQLPPASSPDKPVTNIVKSTRFWQWPTNLVHTNAASSCGECRLRDGRIWGEITYRVRNLYLNKAIIFGLDPATWKTEIIELPSPEGGLSFEVLGENLFFSLENKITKYSFKTKSWTDLPVPMSGHLVRLDNRLFSINDDSIVEISADGNSQTILASARRHPATTLLDMVDDYKDACLLHAPNGSVTAFIKSNLYSLDDKTRTWTQITKLPFQPISISSRAAAGQTVFRYVSPMMGTDRLYVPRDQDSAPMVVRKPPSEVFHDYLSGLHRLEDPLWTDATGWTPADGDRIYLADSKAWVRFSPQFWRNRVNGQYVVGNWPDGDAAVIRVFWPDLGEVLSVPMDLDMRGKSFTPTDIFYLSDGLPMDRRMDVHAIPTPSGIVLINHRVGIWLIPWNNISTTVRTVRAEALERRAARQKTIDRLWAGLTEKYHLTQKDRLTEEQKSAMIDDPVFLELSLDQLDKNHNGRIDPDELKFFDANNNRILEPNEQVGLEITLDLLAQSLMDVYGANRDGPLEPRDYNRLLQNMSCGKELQHVRLDYFDANQDGAISLVELQHLLRDQIYRGVRPQIAAWADEPTDGALKKAVEETLIQRNEYGRQITFPVVKTIRGPLPGRPTLGTLPEQTLLEAAAAGDLAAVEKALDQGAFVDARDYHCLTALIYAAQICRLDIIKLLVAKGANANNRSGSRTGSTTLCFSVLSDNPEIVGFLIDHGADVNGRGKNLATPLYIAAQNNKMESAKCLISRGARLDEIGFCNDAGEQFTPLTGAAAQNHGDMVRLLLKSGVKIDQPNEAGDTALMLVAKRDRAAMAKLLLENGANPNARGPKGHTALIYAGFNGRIETIKLLLDAGADPNATASDVEGPGYPKYDALSVAEQQGQSEAAQLSIRRTKEITPVTGP